MPECSFCKKDYEIHLGLTLVLNDGNVLHFCSSKCRKNWELGRQGKKVQWIKKEKKAKKAKAGIKEETKEKEEKAKVEKKGAAEKKSEEKAQK